MNSAVVQPVSRHDARWMRWYAAANDAATAAAANDVATAAAIDAAAAATAIEASAAAVGGAGRKQPEC